MRCCRVPVRAIIPTVFLCCRCGGGGGAPGALLAAAPASSTGFVLRHALTHACASVALASASDTARSRARCCSSGTLTSDAASPMSPPAMSSAVSPLCARGAVRRNVSMSRLRERTKAASRVRIADAGPVASTCFVVLGVHVRARARKQQRRSRPASLHSAHERRDARLRRCDTPAREKSHAGCHTSAERVYKGLGLRSARRGIVAPCSSRSSPAHNPSEPASPAHYPPRRRTPARRPRAAQVARAVTRQEARHSCVVAHRRASLHTSSTSNSSSASLASSLSPMYAPVTSSTMVCSVVSCRRTASSSVRVVTTWSS